MPGKRRRDTTPRQAGTPSATIKIETSNPIHAYVVLINPTG